jgi:hypothetical protein
MDANMKMKCRGRAGARPDPAFGDGLGYQVLSQPYKEFLKRFVSEKDVSGFNRISSRINTCQISTCSSFRALIQQNHRRETGLIATGVAGVFCARHETALPLGIGDLQKGERCSTAVPYRSQLISNRYSNMTYVYFSALRKWPRHYPTFGSYDIWCQFRPHLFERMVDLPDELHRDEENMDGGLPEWHAGGHKVACGEVHSVKYKKGTGKTDCEGPERVWAKSNNLAFSTKEMNEGNRRDTIEDFFDYHNHDKNIRSGQYLFPVHSCC